MDRPTILFVTGHELLDNSIKNIVKFLFLDINNFFFNDFLGNFRKVFNKDGVINNHHGFIKYVKYDTPILFDNNYRRLFFHGICCLVFA